MDEELKQAIAKQAEQLEAIQKDVKSIKGYVTFQKIMGLIYLLLIIVPIVIGLIYLPPLIKGMVSQYQSLMESTGLSNPAINELLKKFGGDEPAASINIDPSKIDLKNIPPDLLKRLNAK